MNKIMKLSPRRSIFAAILISIVRGESSSWLDFKCSKEGTQHLEWKNNKTRLDVSWDCCARTRQLYELSNGILKDLSSECNDQIVETTSWNMFQNTYGCYNDGCTIDYNEFPWASAVGSQCKLLGGRVIKADVETVPIDYINLIVHFSDRLDCVSNWCSEVETEKLYLSTFAALKKQFQVMSVENWKKDERKEVKRQFTTDGDRLDAVGLIPIMVVGALILCLLILICSRAWSSKGRKQTEKKALEKEVPPAQQAPPPDKV